MARVLEAQYADYNKQYFGGKLPKIPVRWSKFLLSKHSAYGMCYPAFHVSKSGELKTIFPHHITIDSALRMPNDDTMWCMVLLHEMVHVKLLCSKSAQHEWNEHTPRFHREMKRLANRGALNDLW